MLRERFLRKWIFAKSLQQLSGADDVPRVRIVLRESQKHRVDLVRRSFWLTMILNRETFHSPENQLLLVNRLPVLTHLLIRARPGVRVLADFSDGDGDEDYANVLAFSSNAARSVLVPDSDFFNSGGYHDHRRSAAAMPPWDNRLSGIVWRGATTGWTANRAEALDLESPHAIQRLRFCQKLRDTSDVDAKFYAVVESADPDTNRARLASIGVMGEKIAEQEWQNRRFAFDIDGNTNAWSNLFVRLLFGCCVIKVTSPTGFRQWYYDRLTAWKHYVPVAADLHDLHEKIEWCRSHPNKCQAIAHEGQQLALSLTFAGELAAATARINERFSSNRSATKAKALSA